MSSPKRAAKAIVKSAAKAAPKSARRPVAARPAGKPRGEIVDVEIVDGVSADATRLAAALERGIVSGRFDLVTTKALQKLIAAACRVYTARVEAGEPIMPVPKNSISATDVMVTASGLLRAADLAVFELGMWQSWTGR
jgi:hypothetical protein